VTGPVRAPASARGRAARLATRARTARLTERARTARLTARARPSRQTGSARPPRLTARARSTTAAGLLAAACIAWSASPVSGGATGTRPALVAGIGCAVLTLARLAAGDWAPPRGVFENLIVRTGRSLLELLRTVPWAEGTVIAVLVLEALHHSRPWHTGLLGVALIAFLFAVHLAESGARPGVLRPQLPVLAAGLGLLVLGCGAALLPAAGMSAGSGWLRVFAAVAAIVVAALALPA
jgi:hypothetical protein